MYALVFRRHPTRNHQLFFTTAHSYKCIQIELKFAPKRMSGELKYSTQHIVIGRLPVSVATAQGVGSPLCANCRTECAKEHHSFPMDGGWNPPRRRQNFSNTSDTG